jgi:caa(3)-type oxidase subunit IV
LTFATWAIARIDLGPFNTVIALAIAFFKAGLVVWFFMDLRDEPVDQTVCWRWAHMASHPDRAYPS